MMKLQPSRLQCLTLMAGLAAAPLAWAADGPQYKFSGFGTLAGTVTDAANVSFRSSSTQSKGANSTVDLGVDSKLGAQGVVDFGSGLTVTAQVLSQRHRVDSALDSDQGFDLGIEWLLAQYSPSSNLDLRLGRVVLPAYMISDSRNVTYSQPWLRAPLEVYGAMALTTLDGVQAVWRIPFGGSVFSIQPSFGKSFPNQSIGTAVFKPPYARVASLNATWEYGNWLARIGQVRAGNANTSLDLNASYGLPAGTLAPFVVDIEDKFTNMGVQYDDGSAIAMAEYATRRTNDGPASFGGKPWARTDHWYVAGGWHFGKWLPMLAYNQSLDKAAATPATPRTGVDVSLRYDLMSNVSLKAQLSRYQSADQTTFVLPTTTANDRKVNILSAGLDFVF